MKKYLFLTSLLFLSCMVSATEYITSSKLNVRASANSNAKVLTTLEKGVSVDVDTIIKKWAKIEYKDTVAYVSTDHIFANDNGKGGKLDVYVVYGEERDIKKNPDEKAKKLGTVEAGERIFVYGVEDGWCAFYYKGGKAYVKDSGVRQVAPLWLRIVFIVIGAVVALYDIFKRHKITLVWHVSAPLILTMVYGDYVLWIAAFLFLAEAFAGEYAKHNYVSVHTKSGTLDRRIKNNVDEETLREYDEADERHNMKVNSIRGTGALALFFIILLMIADQCSGLYFNVF